MKRKWEAQHFKNPWFSLGFHIDHNDPSITFHLPFYGFYIGNCIQPGFKKGVMMVLTKEQIQEFEEAAKPLVKFLCENCHPHVTVIVEPTRAEILEGSVSVKIEEFIKD